MNIDSINDYKPNGHEFGGIFEASFPPTNESSRNLTAIPNGNSNGPILGFGSLLNLFHANFVHGIIMTVAWGVCPFVGIFVARYLKEKLGVWWYRIHVVFMLGGVGGLTIAGFLIKYLTAQPPHFQSVHSVNYN